MLACHRNEKPEAQMTHNDPRPVRLNVVADNTRDKATPCETPAEDYARLIVAARLFLPRMGS